MSISLITDLLNQNDARSLILKECSTYRSNVKHMDNAGRELIYVIIKGYYEMNLPDSEKPSTCILPYNGLYNKKDEVEFDYKELPDTLKRILCLFAEKHIKIMEDKAILDQTRLDIMNAQ
ncbi:MAG: hypothetical protein JKX76_01590 [Colwellia sp.]|nr:hypothetical protein [Colwellia sp.]